MPETTYRISELTAIDTINNGDLIEVSNVDANSESGYASRKASMTDLGNKLLNDIEYSTELVTNDKRVIGAINEIAQGAGGSVNIVSDIDTPASIMSFNDGGDNIPMKSLIAEIKAVQAGTGTPSPTNVRNITGVSSVTVTQKDDLTTPTTTKTVTVALGQTVYGGYLDVISGLLTITSKYVELDGSSDEDWYFVSGTSKFYCAYPDIAEVYITGDFSNLYEFGGQAGSSSSVIEDKHFYTQRNESQPQYNRFWIYDSSYSTIEDLRTGLASQTMQIVCPLRETEYITVQLTPNQVATLAGLNNIYADSGDIKEVEYFNNKANDIARMIELISGKQVDLIGTLATGQTSLTIQNDVIKTDSTIEVFTDPEVDYNSITVTAGSITITFDAQASDVSVKVRIS